MPIPYTLARAMIVAGALACAGISSPSTRAEDHDRDLVASPELEAVEDEDGDVFRDLRPAPKPGYDKLPGYGYPRRPVVTLRPSSRVVPVGAPVSFGVGSSISGYGHLYVLSASGRVQVWMENVPIAGGQRLHFPLGGIGVRAAPPAGREELLLIVTRQRIDGFVGYGPTRSPRLLPYGRHAFKQALTAKFAGVPRQEWGYARTAVEVVDRRFTGPALGWNTPNRWDDQWEAE